MRLGCAVLGAGTTWNWVGVAIFIVKIPPIRHVPRGMIKLKGTILCTSAVGLLTVALAQVAMAADSFSMAPSEMRNTYGEVGMLDMPSAHMAADGDFGFSIGVVSNYERYAAFFQALPWMEASFRYSRVPWWAGEKVYYDRSFGAKIRLLNEADNFADVSVGWRDVLGTGVYGGEFVTASKHWGPFDATFGLGWGRLGDNGTIPNPFGVVFSSFNTRARPDTAGQFDVKQYFHGKRAGIFGGLTWDTPISGLKLVAEYSSDKYSMEAAFPAGLKIRSPVNVGLNYTPSSSYAISAGWFYGTTYGVTLSLRGNAATTYPQALRVGPRPPPAVIRTDDQQQVALIALRESRTLVNTGDAKPFITISTPMEAQQTALRQALMVQGLGVRGIEFVGKSVVINSHLAEVPAAQCERIARITAMTVTAPIDLIVSDLNDPKGRVVFCAATPQPTRIASADAKPAVQSDAGPTPPIDEDAKVRAFRQKIRTALDGQYLVYSKMVLRQSDIWIYYENYHYREASEAAGRVARVLMKEAPTDIEIFHLVPSQLGVPMEEITIVRSGLERADKNNSSDALLSHTIKVRYAPMKVPPEDPDVPSRYPTFSVSFDPKLTQHLFDPDKPIQFMVYGDITGLIQLAPGLSASAQVTGTIWSDYTFNRDAGSALPHVRTDLLKYIQQGKYGIANLEMTYLTRIAPNVFVSAHGGLLEDMFAGFGGQVLWRPDHSRITFGADLYQVWQREYHRLFAFQKYNVMTGHVSVYYDTPWYDLRTAVHVGRYLAGDRGATFEITRRFATGIEIGAWVTFTNVPSNKFGEGSFDKGIILHIPFEWGLPISSQSAYDLHLASLTRDGGQRLSGDDSLYEATKDTSYSQIVEHIDDVIDP